MQSILLWLIKAYQLVFSPWVGQHCRFYPTCSSYGMEAIRKFGAFHGSWLTLVRITKCHPFHAGGIDPVPEKSGNRK